MGNTTERVLQAAIKLIVTGMALVTSARLDGRLGKPSGYLERCSGVSIAITPPAGAPSPPFIEGRKHLLVTPGSHLDWHKNEVAGALKVLANRLPE